jgi:hypothetical protein
MGGNCLVRGRTIISAVRRHLANRIVNLIEQQADLGRIVRVLIGQRLRHDHAAGCINRQMQLAPRPARLRAVLGKRGKSVGSRSFPACLA